MKEKLKVRECLGQFGEKCRKKFLTDSANRLCEPCKRHQKALLDRNVEVLGEKKEQNERD